MKTIIGICIYIIILPFSLKAQSTYPSTAYAAIGDTVYLTSAGIGSFDFTTTGANITWNYSTLQGSSQDQLAFRNPTQTGFSHVQWPYIYTTANTNLSSTDGQSIAIGSIQTYNPNDYFKLSGSVLQQSASSYQVIVGDTKIPIKNTYTSPDVLYKFPITYGGTADSSVAQYATNIPGLYYNSSVINRKNIVDGYGTVITPYGTFSNALRITSTVVQKDSIVIDTIALPAVTTTYRELKWLDPSRNYPVLIVQQNKIGTQFVTISVTYLDHKQYFQPIALFASYPISPVVGDTVNFQNLSANGSSYIWDFGDSLAGAANSSTNYNGQYIYTTPGTYHVKLKVFNGSLVDSMSLPFVISGPPTASYTYSSYNDTVYFQNSSLYGISYSWNFGDAASGTNNVSTATNPYHLYSDTGTFHVSLIAINGNTRDTLVQLIRIQDTTSTVTITAVQESLQNEIVLLVYPNPVRDLLIVSSPENYNEVAIYDQKGIKLFSSSNSTGTIDMANFQQGCYMLQLTKINGSPNYVKIIKN